MCIDRGLLRNRGVHGSTAGREIDAVCRFRCTRCRRCYTGIARRGSARLFVIRRVQARADLIIRIIKPYYMM